MSPTARFASSFVFFLICGCGWFRSGPSPVSEKAPSLSRHLNPGKVLIVPFSAGEGVEASKELDQISLMIVKGVAEELGRLSAPFTVVGEDELEQTDLLLEGHIVKRSESRGVSNWMPGGKKLVLGTEIEIKDRASGDRLMVLSPELRASGAQEDWRQLAYRLGQEIARELKDSTP